MRKLGLIGLAVFIFSILLCGCQIDSQINENPKKINVVSTIFPQYDFARQIAGDKINLKMLTPPAAESHSYIYVDYENDNWVDNILNFMGDFMREFRWIGFIGLIGLVAYIFSTLLSGCRMNSKINESSKKISVVATIFPQYDFARQIAGDKINLKMLIPPGAESHSYEPTPQDMINIQKSDVFIYVGGENDNWIDNILNSIDISQKKVISLLDCVDVLDENFESIAAQSDSNSHREVDEHVWTSPKNAVKIAQKISETLCDLDADNADFYNKNLNKYIEQLKILDNKFKDVVATGKRKTLVFGDRFAFRYFAEEYGLNCYSAFSSCSSQTETSAASVAYIIDKVKEFKIPVVLKMELSNENIAKTVAQETNAKVLTMNSCHNVLKSEFENGETYLNYMNKNLDVLKEALN